MAESSVKSSKLKQMPKHKGNGAPPVEPAPAPETPFDSEPAPEAAAPAEPPKKKGRPPGTGGIASSNASKTILQIIAEVPAAYWTAGTARIKIYRLAPLINRNVTSEHRFITECLEPIDEQGLKRECGSGRYRLYLNYKNSAGGGERETARGEVDILDPAFPPKIPAGEWMDDPRNRQWAWAKPKEPAEAQAPAAAVDTILEGMRLGNEIRKEAREELQSVAPPTPPPAAAATVDPWAAAERILNMRSENPMVTILMQRMEAQDRAAEEARKREADLQRELRDMMRQQPANAAPKSFIEQMTEFGTAMETISKTPLGKIFGMGGAAEAAAPVVRSRISGTLETIKEIAPIVIDPLRPLFNAWAHRLNNPAPQQNGQNGGNGQPARQQAQQNPEQELITWVERTLMESIIEYLNESDGGAFAEFVYNGWPARLKPLQEMKHHQLPDKQGAPVIFELFKHSDIWGQHLAHRQEQFKTFIEQFCKWRPEGEEEPATQQAAAASAVHSDEVENWESGETTQEVNS